MQSKQLLPRPFIFATGIAAVAFVLAVGLRQGAAAFFWTLVWGAILGFVVPRGAWRWVLLLSAWILVAVPTHRLEEQSLCPTFASGPPLSPWLLLVVPPFAVYAGVFADWIVTLGLQKLASLGGIWILKVVKPALRFGVVAVAALVVGISALELAQPLQPYGPGNTYCWDEFCFVVNSVKQVKSIGSGADAAVAQGTFYIVDADLESPWWGRFVWSNDAVYVIDDAGADYHFSHAGQRASDLLAGFSRSNCHLIRGASEHERIVFDLPDDVVQPRLLVRDTLGFEGFLGGIRGNIIYVKPAFNLRYE